MGNKLYVGGLPYAATESQLNDLFSAHGTVESARVITDKFTGQSRGFGFVEMSTEEEAKAAITALNGSDMGGRQLTVNEAKPQESRSGGGGRTLRRRRPRRTKSLLSEERHRLGSEGARIRCAPSFLTPPCHSFVEFCLTTPSAALVLLFFSRRRVLALVSVLFDAEAGVTLSLAESTPGDDPTPTPDCAPGSASPAL